MKNEIAVFQNPDFGEIRTLAIDGEPWFLGVDVAQKLGYTNLSGAISDHVDSEDRQILQKSENATFEIPNRGLTIINESGLYSLIPGVADDIICTAHGMPALTNEAKVVIVRTKEK